MELEFFKCKHCGQIIKKIKDTKVSVVCCGEKMEKIIPNTTDAAKEKHVPVISVEGLLCTVTVSTVSHPMQDVHYIEWVIISTNQGSYKYELKPGMEPVAKFNLREGEVVENAYALCNLHGLWAAK